MVTLESFQRQETSRLEAFSDGVFAFALTLLVLGLHDPNPNGQGSLLQGLWSQWQVFFAFATSFAAVLVMWMNHHNMFSYVRRIDRSFMLLNGLMLFFVVIVPFTTSLVADHILTPDSNVAAGIYAGTFFLMASAWNLLWYYASSHHRLLGSHVTELQVREISRQYLVGPISGLVALFISFFSGPASIVAVDVMMGFFAVTATMARQTKTLP